MNENLHDIRRKFTFLEVLWKIRRISRHRTPGIPCFSGAAVAGIPLYFLTKGLIGTSAASLLMMGAMLPFFFFAMYEKNGFPAEKILYFMLRQKILTPGIRPYRSENLYKQLEEKEKLRREVRYLEEKAKGRTGKPQKKQL